MHCAILLFNQRRHTVSESHYLGKKESLEGSKTTAREHPSVNGGLCGVLEAPHKYSPWLVWVWYYVYILTLPMSRVHPNIEDPI